MKTKKTANSNLRQPISYWSPIGHDSKRKEAKVCNLGEKEIRPN